MITRCLRQLLNFVVSSRKVKYKLEKHQSQRNQNQAGKVKRISSLLSQNDDKIVVDCFNVLLLLAVAFCFSALFIQMDKNMCMRPSNFLKQLILPNLCCFSKLKHGVNFLKWKMGKGLICLENFFSR